jgi:hypothetical protein
MSQAIVQQSKVLFKSKSIAIQRINPDGPGCRSISG